MNIVLGLEILEVYSTEAEVEFGGIAARLVSIITDKNRTVAYVTPVGKGAEMLKLAPGLVAVATP
jgi:hypothetical protein